MSATQARPLPGRALLISVAALAVPAASWFIAPEWMSGEGGVLVWLTALVPAFLMAYYKGWRGASVALALGMAVLTLAQVALQLLGLSEPNWGLLLGLVVVYIGACLGLGTFAELLHGARRDAERQALTDVLTDLPNRRHALIVLEGAFAAAERGVPLSVALFDLDHFKGFNDRYGHEVGDEVLKTFAGVLGAATRRMNLSARFGGEEFISVLTDADREAARAFAERVRRGLGAIDLPWGPVTVSCGVATYEKGMGAPDFLVAAADQALYAAKEGGRDRTVVAGLAAPPSVGVARAPSAGGDEAAEAGKPVPPEAPHPVEPSVAVKAASARSGRRTVMVVDDDDQVRRTIVQVIRELDHSVIEAGNPLTALDLLRHDGLHVDLLITDVMMPEMSGITFVEKVSEQRPGIPVLYVSGYIHGEVSWPGVPGSVTDFLEKPVSVEVLEDKVARLLEGR